MAQILDATTSPELLADARAIFGEYQASLASDPNHVAMLEAQGFDQEIAGLPGKYAPPSGRLLLASVLGRAAGCVALQRVDEDRAEMKRMYVRPEYRGQSIGRILAAAIVDHARAIGYRRMLLDTLPHMKEAVALYRSIGFRDTARYRYNPIEETVFFELIL